MKTTVPTYEDLRSSVISVPPLARKANFELDAEANRALLQHLHAGGVRTVLYGGNANLYNIEARQFEELLASLPGWAPDDMWLIPSIGPSFGQMLDQIPTINAYDYPTAMILPLIAPATSSGTATGIRKAVERLGKAVILYLKWESYLAPEEVKELVDDGLISSIKYAIVRENPAVDKYLRRLLDLVDSRLVISGIGERPVVTHWTEFGLTSFTSGSVCVGPRLSTRILHLLQDGQVEEAEALRRLFLPLEDLRDGIHPVRVMHDAVTESGIADMGPILPLLSNLSAGERGRVREAARMLLELNAEDPVRAR